MIFDELPLQTLTLAAAILLLGGLVKGVLGIGLPLVSVPLLSLLVPVPTAIAVMGFPVLISNIYQVRQGGELRPAFVRFWPLLLALVVGILLGARLLVSLDEQRLSMYLGLMVIAFSGLNLISPNLTVPARYERLGGPAVGFTAGLLGGFSSFIGPPIAMYMVALRMPKDAFVSAVAMAYATGTVPLYAALATVGIFGGAEALLSAAALVPVLLGVALGQHLRRRIPQQTFRLLILGMLILIGANLVRRSFAL